MNPHGLLAGVLFTGIQCSTAHITDDDNTVLYHASHQQGDYGNSEWIHYTGTGYLIRLMAWQYPILHLKRLGLSKACRRLIVMLMQRHQIAFLHLDAAGNVLPGFATFDW
jgi:hypothetical protein